MSQEINRHLVQLGKYLRDLSISRTAMPHRYRNLAILKFIIHDKSIRYI